MMYKTFLLFFLVFGILFLPAKAELQKVNAEVKQNKVVQLDSSKLEVHQLDKTALDGYAQDKDFDYDNEVKHGETFWERFWRVFWEWVEKLFGGRKKPAGAPSQIVRYLIIGVAICLLVYAIIKITGVGNIFGRKPKPVALPYSESLENIHEISFDDEIARAVEQRNYRLAVRLLYLRSLKQLNDAGVIEWKLEKTNAVYVNEIANADQRQSFGTLTRQFEYVWYGDFPINGQSFQNIDVLFNDFKQLIG